MDDDSPNRDERGRFAPESDAPEPQEPAGEPVGGTGAPEATEGGTGAQEGATDAQDGATDAQDGASSRPHREAAKRRRQLREVEAERDALRERLDAYDRAEVERLAGERLESPADFWLATDLDALRGEDGALDAEKVTAELARVTAEKPHWRKKSPRPEVHQGARAEAPEPPSFGATIKRTLTGR